MASDREITCDELMAYIRASNNPDIFGFTEDPFAVWFFGKIA